MPPTNLPQGVALFDAANILKENGHQNFKHHFKPGHSFTLSLNGTGLAAYNNATKNIQWVIQHAIDNNLRLRAMGNNWAFSPVASADSMINTKALNLRFPLKESSLADAYLQSGKTKEDVLFVQCGNMIWNISKYIEINLRRCLRASGGSNGQTIAGATSTGTHGGALYTGSVHDAIVGLHIITGPDTHVWMERASKPVVTDAFVNNFGATIIRDDEMFNAAVVSFGSFGVIHGILLETEPIFLLKEHRYESVTYTDELKDAIANLDFNTLRNIIPELPLETPDNKLYHCEVSVNLHNLEANNSEKGIYIQVFYKQPCPVDYVPEHDYTKSTASYGKDTMGIVAQVLDAIGPDLQSALIKPLVNQLFISGLRSEQTAAKTIGEVFCFTRFRGKAASAALAVDTRDVFRAVDAIAEINKTHPLAGGIALRFVKGTPATLGFTKFANSCVLEMDGVDGELTRQFFTMAWLKLEELNIPYTLHWGKLNFILDAPRVRLMYGNDKVDRWLQCRAQLLNKDSRRVFTNKFMEQCGLVNIETPPQPPTPVIT